MNIVEAAMLVKSGLLVRRSSWPPGNHMGLDECGLYIAVHERGVNLQRHFSISIEEILGVDWEVFHRHHQVKHPVKLVLKKR